MRQQNERIQGDAPIKVSHVTKERVRLAAAVLGVTQQEFVRRAVDEFLASQTDLPTRVDEARKALLGDDDAMLAYLRGEAA